MRLSLNRNQIKYIVIIAMAIDHIAWVFVPEASAGGQIMHFIGRLTGPTMVYFVAEGYLHTSNLKRYAMRLFLFSLAAWPAYSLFEYGTWPTANFSVLTTLLLGLLAIWVYEKKEWAYSIRFAAVAGLAALSVRSDWALYGVLIPVLLVAFRDDEKKKWIYFTAFTILYIILAIAGDGWQTAGNNIGMLLPLIILRFCYNGESGSKAAFHKWFFYIFYPAHLLLLYILKIVLCA